MVEPEILAAELLAEINDFSTARSVNFFLGNLAKQFARKRIARRDAIALAYISQLLFNSLPALERQLDAEQEAEEDAEIARINTRIRQQNRELAARRNQQASNSAQAAAPDAGTAAGPVVGGVFRPVRFRSAARANIMGRAHRKNAKPAPHCAVQMVE